MHGRGHVWQRGMYGVGGVHGRGHVWQGGACVMEDVWWGVVRADGTHPTGMHSCFIDGDQQLNGRMQGTEVRTICYVESFTRYNIF